MIVEDYVSFETAKLLKENGFNHWCYKCYGTAVYHKGVPISFDEECDLKSEGLENEIEYVDGGYLYDFGCDNRKKDAKVWAAPTLQIARKWIKEKYKRHIEVRITNHSISDMVNVIRYYWIIFDAETARCASRRRRRRLNYGIVLLICRSDVRVWLIENRSRIVV